MPASRIRGRPAGTLPLLEALQLHALIKWNNRVDLALRVPVAVTAEHASSSSPLTVLASLLFMYTPVMLTWKVSCAASGIRLLRELRQPNSRFPHPPPSSHPVLNHP